MSIEQAWNRHTRQVQSVAGTASDRIPGQARNDGGVRNDGATFDSAFMDAESSFSGEKVFQAKDPGRDNQFPETPKSAIGLDGNGKYPDSQSLITMLNQQFPNQKFEALFLGKNGFGDVGAQALAKTLQNNQSVKHLILPHNQLSDFAVAALADMLKANRFIGWLVLNNNQIGNGGATAIAEALETNDSVQHVILADNRIGDDGAVALSGALKKNQSVQSLCLQGNPIGTDGVKALVSLCRQSSTLRKLDLRDIGEVEVSVMRELEDVAGAKGILLRG